MEENMKTAITRDAARNGLFYFRKSLLPEDDEDEEVNDTPPTEATPEPPPSHENEYALMNIDTIINGKVMSCDKEPCRCIMGALVFNFVV